MSQVGQIVLGRWLTIAYFALVFFSTGVRGFDFTKKSVGVSNRILTDDYNPALAKEPLETETLEIIERFGASFVVLGVAGVLILWKRRMRLVNNKEYPESDAYSGPALASSQGGSDYTRRALEQSGLLEAHQQSIENITSTDAARLPTDSRFSPDSLSSQIPVLILFVFGSLAATIVSVNYLFNNQEYFFEIQLIAMGLFLVLAFFIGGYVKIQREMNRRLTFERDSFVQEDMPFAPETLSYYEGLNETNEGGSKLPIGFLILGIIVAGFLAFANLGSDRVEPIALVFTDIVFVYASVLLLISSYDRGDIIVVSVASLLAIQQSGLVS